MIAMYTDLDSADAQRILKATAAAVVACAPYYKTPDLVGASPQIARKGGCAEGRMKTCAEIRIQYPKRWSCLRKPDQHLALSCRVLSIG